MASAWIKPPATPKLEDLTLKESVSQYGITRFLAGGQVEHGAWDSGVLNYYHPEHRARLPISLKSGDSLASSSPAPIDGWKQNHADRYYLNAVAKQRKK